MGLFDWLRPKPAPQSPAPTPPPPHPGDARFLACVAIVLGKEGGFVNDPADPGGATNLGITRATLEAWRGQPVSEADVRKLTQAEALQIYRARYWNVMRCDDLPPGIDLMVFDFGVNAGPSRAASHLQRAVGARVDGAIGPRTIAAAKAANAHNVIDMLVLRREQHYRSLPTFPKFGRGWLNRTASVASKAKAMVA